MVDRNRASGLQMRSTLRSTGVLEVALLRVATPELAADEVLIRVDAAPINPSDLANMFAGLDLSRTEAGGTAAEPLVCIPVAEGMLKALAGRLEQPMAVGNEGAGVVIEAGDSEAAQALLGRTVAIVGGAMYAQYRCAKVAEVLVLPEGTTPAAAASCFVNPLTALGMVETLRSEGHSALVHTAAASSLGQMLHKVCLADNIPLVNIVRKPEQAELLRALGALHVCDSSAASFDADLHEAIAATGATLAFDAVGGGTLASKILGAMEAAASKETSQYSRYGSTRHKQVYIYGNLDRAVTEIRRDNFGAAWGVGGWLLMNFLSRIGPAATMHLQARVAAELHTTFASHYSRVVSLAQALSPEEIAVYGNRATGQKYLIDPSR